MTPKFYKIGFFILIVLLLIAGAFFIFDKLGRPEKSDDMLMDISKEPTIVIGADGDTMAFADGVLEEIESLDSPATKHLTVARHFFSDNDMNVATHYFDIVNNSDTSYYDVAVSFYYWAESGTLLLDNKQTIHVEVPAHSKKYIEDFNDGFIPQDVSRATVYIEGAKSR